MEKQIKREEIYKGRVIHVVVDDIEMDKGGKSKREVVLHNGGACVAIKDVDGKYFMVKQYRYALQTDMLEFCAGKIEIGEDPDTTVLREAEEEVGQKIKNIQKFGYMVPTCGYSSEKIYLYYAEVDETCEKHFDYDEDLNTHKYSFQEIMAMIQDGRINDGKTISICYHLLASGIESL